VVVSAGVVLNTARTEVLLSFRNAKQDQGNLWEYPGGKAEEGESPEIALSRELQEEIGITPEAFEPLTKIVHDYPNKRVELHFFVVTSFQGQPQSLEGQTVQWHGVEALDELHFPEANTPIAAKLHNWLQSQ